MKNLKQDILLWLKEWLCVFVTIFFWLSIGLWGYFVAWSVMKNIFFGLIVIIISSYFLYYYIEFYRVFIEKQEK